MTRADVKESLGLPDRMAFPRDSQRIHCWHYRVTTSAIDEQMLTVHFDGYHGKVERIERSKFTTEDDEYLKLQTLSIPRYRGCGGAPSAGLEVLGEP